MENFSSLITFGMKAALLMLIVLYLIFSTFVYLNVRGMNNFVYITYFRLSVVIHIIYIIHIFLVLSLFFAALVIL